jgi:hypothetical protein
MVAQTNTIAPEECFFGCKDTPFNRHNLTFDRHAVAMKDEQLAFTLAELSRCADALLVIARIVGNNSQEPDSTGSTPLAVGVVSGLMSATEIIARYIDVRVGEAYPRLM